MFLCVGVLSRASACRIDVDIAVSGLSPRPGNRLPNNKIIVSRLYNDLEKLR